MLKRGKISERDKLKIENAKLKYRVGILMRSLEEEENKNKIKN